MNMSVQIRFSSRYLNFCDHFIVLIKALGLVLKILVGLEPILQNILWFSNNPHQKILFKMKSNKKI